MKALETREKIFAAAAKSQSSKAPRKSKTNPDPLASVRQGTDYAIAQLESVYTARRRTESELKKIELKKSQLMRGAGAGPTARITASPETRMVKVAAVMAEGGWKPRYEIRVQQEGQATLAMLAETSPVPAGYTAKLVPATMDSPESIPPVPLPAGPLPKLAQWKVALDKASIRTVPVPLFSFSLTNSTKTILPAGEAAIYSQGEYIGTAPLPLLLPDATATVTNHQPK